MSEEIYVSVDVETDGPIPGPNSMLSFGAVALKSDGTEISSCTYNLELLPGAKSNVDTMAWWSKPEQQEAWEACRKNQVSPDYAMTQFVEWVEKLPGKPVFVAYPAGFDFLFGYWYCMNFVGRSPFSFSALDIKSYASAVLKLPYRDSTKKNMPKEWFPKVPHTHVAIDDAREQGLLYINMMKANIQGYKAV